MKKKPFFKAVVPDLDDYIGRTVEIKGKKIKIETIVGNVGMTLGRAPKDQRPQYAEINGKYLISFLRLFAQMQGAKDITEKQFRQYEEMEFWSEPNKKEDPLKYKRKEH